MVWRWIKKQQVSCGFNLQISSLRDFSGELRSLLILDLLFERLAYPLAIGSKSSEEGSSSTSAAELRDLRCCESFFAFIEG